MFDNIGRKIKKLAVVITWVGIILSIFSGLSALNLNTFSGLLIIAVGCLASWLSSFILYGFGELIESNKKSEIYLSEIHRNVQLIRDEIESEDEADESF